MIQAGDILLTGTDNLGSRALQLFLHGRYSHCIPMISESIGLNTTWSGGANIENVSSYLSGSHRVLRLRCKELDIPKFIDMCLWLDGSKYDYRSYLGFASNKDFQDSSRYNCAESGLLACHAGGVLQDRTLDRITPHSFFEFSSAGLFDIERIS